MSHKFLFDRLRDQVADLSAKLGPEWTQSVLRPTGAKSIWRLTLHDMQAIVRVWGSDARCEGADHGG
jgi:hypothetical protein